MAKAEDEILRFVREALTRGLPRNEIERVLGQAGWRTEQIRETLNTFAEGVEFPVPVPRPKPYLSAREVFVYLILFSALYCTAFNLGALTFHIIEKVFPDRLQNLRWVDDGIRWNMAAIIVTLPIFLLTFRAVTRVLAQDSAKRNSLPRKWLTYLTLFVAAIALISDGTVLVYNALGGELTIRFLLKVATVAIIAGGIFSYFLGDMRKEETV